jgi:hypothetical protein
MVKKEQVARGGPTTPSSTADAGRDGRRWRDGSSGRDSGGGWLHRMIGHPDVIHGRGERSPHQGREQGLNAGRHGGHRGGKRRDTGASAASGVPPLRARFRGLFRQPVEPSSRVHRSCDFFLAATWLAKMRGRVQAFFALFSRATRSARCPDARGALERLVIWSAATCRSFGWQATCRRGGRCTAVARRRSDKSSRPKAVTSHRTPKLRRIRSAFDGIQRGLCTLIFKRVGFVCLYPTAAAASAPSASTADSHSPFARLSDAATPASCRLISSALPASA